MPALYYKPGIDATIHLSNEIAFDAFRLAVVMGNIEPANIRWRVHTEKEIFKGLINEYGVAVDEFGKPKHPWVGPSCKVVENILMAACMKRKDAKGLVTLHRFDTYVDPDQKL